jgi:lantibiotic leader peptide-processing serine protease
MGVSFRLIGSRPRAVLALAALAALSAPAVPVHAATVGAVQTYIVTYRDGASSQGADAVVQGAGGQLVYNYSDIGVVIARSDRSDFASNVMTAAGVDGAVATAKFATQLKVDKGDASADTPTTTAPLAGDNLSGLQWDMKQIKAFDAQAITSGSSKVIAGDIDTGVDFTHPDLAANIDFADSAGCLSGAPDTSPSAWKDDNGHGTHTAGTIAAARNGIGIVGVAPNVRLAAIKAGNVDGFFFPEAVVCAFHWAGTHHFNVTNNSYFADPFYFNCNNDPTQRAIWKAEARAIRFAMQQGVTVVAAEGNFADDLAHPTQDTQSPDNTTPVTRPVNNDCVVIPVEIPGVIGVTADGNLMQKSFYSNYGVGVTQVTAPGGDSVLQRTPAAPNGRVLSTFPAYPVAINCVRVVFDGAAKYCYLQGTSMASPHVTGVVALVESLGVASPSGVEARINTTADAIPCPSATVLAEYAFFNSVNNGAPQACVGGTGYNSWYGHGQVDALAAVS